MTAPGHSEPTAPPDQSRRLSWPPRLFWLFSGTLLFVVLGLGLRFGLSIYLQQVAIRAIEAVGGQVETTKRGPQWLRDWLSDELSWVIDVPTDVLFIKNSFVSDVDLVHLQELTSLERLSLADTQVTDAGLVHLRGLTRLKRLGLDGTQITNAGITNLQGFTHLHDLTICDTPITGDGISALRKALPRTVIVPESR